MPTQTRRPGRRRTATRLAFAAAALCGAWPAADAHGDVRTGQHENDYVIEELSSPTRPMLRAVQIRYDAGAGRLDATVSFVHPLALAGARELRPWRVTVALGDWLTGTLCTGEGRSNPMIEASLGDDAPATLDEADDGIDRVKPLPVDKTFTPDRSAVTLTVTNPRLRGRGPICANADVFDKPKAYESDHVSSTFGFLLDGFDTLDGAVERDAHRHLWGEVFDTNAAYKWASELRYRQMRRVACTRRPRAPRQTTQTLDCRVRSVWMVGMPRRPTLTLRGTLTLDAVRLLGPFQEGEPEWSANMHGRLRWRRCPARPTLPAARRGRVCQKEVRWNGRGPLLAAVDV